MTLINPRLLQGIRTGAEELTEALLDSIRIDEASEAARHHLLPPGPPLVGHARPATV